MTATFFLRSMGYSPWLGHLPQKERVSWLRYQLNQTGFAINSTVANCGIQMPRFVVERLDNNWPSFKTECTENGIEIVITDYEITFKNESNP